MLQGATRVLARSTCHHLEDLLVSAPRPQHQLLYQLPGVRLLGDKVQEGFLQSKERLTSTSSLSISQHEKLSREVLSPSMTGF